MRILHITYPYISTPPLGYGGSEKVASQIVEGLVERGNDVHLVATGDSTTKAKLHYIYSKHLTLANFSPYYNIQQHLFAKELVRYLGIDIVHNHMGEFGYNIIQGKKNITTLHNDYKIRRGTCVAISKNQAQRLGVNQVVYNAIQPEKYVYSEDKENYMLWLGNCIPAKGAEVAIRLAKELNYKLVMCLKIDKGTEIEKYYNTVIKPALKGTENLITVKGIVDKEEKLQLYSKAKVFLMPISWDEPFGLVVLEAMSSGTPVVAFNRGSMKEIVTDKTGFVIKAGNYPLYKLAVSQILFAGRNVNIKSADCLELAKKFSVDRMVEGYLRVYEGVL